MQGRIIDSSDVDVLIAANDDDQLPWSRIRRIVVPTNGSPQALAGVEVAGRLAESCGATVVLLAVVDPAVAGAVRRRGAGTSPDAPGTAHLQDARTILRSMEVPVRQRVRHGNPEEEVPAELASGRHDLAVFGCRKQPGKGFTWFGPTAESVIAQTAIPYVLLVTRAAGPAAEERPET